MKQYSERGMNGSSIEQSRLETVKELISSTAKCNASLKYQWIRLFKSQSIVEKHWIQINSL